MHDFDSLVLRTKEDLATVKSTRASRSDAQRRLRGAGHVVAIV
jgi:hypothetical protein